MQLEALDGGVPGGAAGERISFTALRAGPPGAPQRCRENLERLEWAAPGFDIDAAEVERIVSDLHGECSDLTARDPALSGEHRLLAQFAELRALTRSRHGDNEDEGELVRSPEEHLYAFLGSLDALVAGLPDHYAEELRWRCATTGSRPSTARRHSRRRATAFSWPSGGPPPCSARCSRSSTVASSRRKRSPGSRVPTSGRCSTGWPRRRTVATLC